MNKKTKIVVESNAIARAKILPKPSSVWEERLISVLASKNERNDTEFGTFKIDFRELVAEGKDLSTEEYRNIRECVNQAGSMKFELPIGTRGIRVIPIFSILTLLDNGTLEGRFNPELKPYYLELQEQFSLRRLPEFQRLSSIYAQALFRLLSSWKNAREVEIPLQDLFKFLEVPPSFRENFKDFRKYVLERSEKEITDPNRGDFPFTWEAIRGGKQTAKSKVIAIKFSFPQKEQVKKQTKMTVAKEQKGEYRPGADYFRRIQEVIKNPKSIEP